MSLHRTTDGGATWQKLWSDAGGAGSQHGIATEITFVPNDPQKVWIAGRTKLYFSSDMGATLTEDPLTANGTVLNWPLVQLTNNNTGYLLTTGALMRTLTANAVVTSARDEHTSNPDMYSLAQNYPNPFNPATTISYQIAQNEMVSLTVTDAIGRVVKTLVNEVKEPGSYSVEFNAVDLSSGVYFYTLRAGDFSATKKLILLR
jgi:hypothetical protein